ncbi:hypothetical protein GCM10022200_05600 [Microbacterium awajiense]|uniref:Uncharacterized protein n=1 Tax=Microbacterium awajiense TaxID=415214 RepID=A0ABP7A729_9MICO
MTTDDIAVSILDIALALTQGTGTGTINTPTARAEDIYLAAAYLAAGLAAGLADAPGAEDTASSILENLQWQIRINQITPNQQTPA